MNIFKKLFGKVAKPTIEAENILNSDAEKEYESIIRTLKKFKKTAFLPATKESENAFSDKSKIGGFPYFRNENDWPKCPSCEKHMQLFLQLNLQELPENKKQGLIQLFYCTTSEPLCEFALEAFFPFSKSVECREIEVNEESASIKPKIDNLFNKKLIVGWNAKDDYPHPGRVWPVRH